MKKYILLIAALVSGFMASAENEKILKSDIEKVTVFLQGAQVHRTTKTSIPKGVTKLVVEGIARNFSANSIQVKGKGDFIILDVATKLHYPKPVTAVTSEMPDEIKKEINLLTDSLEDFQWKLQATHDKITALETERNILLTSGVINGQKNNDSIAALKDAMNYLRVKLAEIDALILKHKEIKQDQTKINSRMNTRLAELRNYKNNTTPINTSPTQPVQQVIVTVSSDKSTYGYLNLSYMVHNAGWIPAYDLRADDISEPVKLTYKANVFQSTGVAWNNVDITLSSINPNQSNVKPQLAPWYVNYYQPVQQPIYNGNARAKTTAYDNAEVHVQEELDDVSVSTKSLKDLDAKHVSNYTQMTNTLTMVEFEIGIKYTIPSDGQHHMMAIKSEEIPSVYEHFIVPKLDKDAFLVAHLTGWEDMNLLPAQANIFYDGTFVGQTRINPEVMSDTLELALGRDRGIYVTRKKTSDEEKIKPLSSEKTKTMAYQINIKNYKNTEIKLTVEDQIPISSLEDIKVTMLDAKDADYNKNTGLLIWKKTIDPKETLKFQFEYSIKFDKDKTLAAH